MKGLRNCFSFWLAGTTQSPVRWGRRYCSLVVELKTGTVSTAAVESDWKRSIYFDYNTITIYRSGRTASDQFVASPSLSCYSSRLQPQSYTIAHSKLWKSARGFVFSKLYLCTTQAMSKKVDGRGIVHITLNLQVQKLTTKIPETYSQLLKMNKIYQRWRLCFNSVYSLWDKHKHRFHNLPSTEVPSHHRGIAHTNGILVDRNHSRPGKKG